MWSVEDWLLCAHTQLTWLMKTNAFKAIFEICWDSPLAIINSFRLGSVPTVPKSFSEINTARGNAALLLLALTQLVCSFRSTGSSPMETTAI